MLLWIGLSSTQSPDSLLSHFFLTISYAFRKESLLVNKHGTEPNYYLFTMLTLRAVEINVKVCRNFLKFLTFTIIVILALTFYTCLGRVRHLLGGATIEARCIAVCNLYIAEPSVRDTLAKTLGGVFEVSEPFSS